MFITIDGIDGAGKTTVCNILAERHPESVMLLRTPGYSLPHIRDLVLNPEYSLDKKARIMFFLGEMVDINANTLSKLRNNKIIISDRFYVSTYVYQFITQIKYFTMAERRVVLDIFNVLLPTIDNTFILTTDINTALDRAKGHNEFTSKDVFEAAAVEEWERRKAIYDTIEESYIAPKLGKVSVIDTTNLTAEEVADEIEGGISKCLNK